MRSAVAFTLAAISGFGSLACTTQQSESSSSSKCARSSEATPGELGKARFAHFTGAFGCLFGCGGAEEPIAERSKHDVLVLNRKQLPAFTVTSATPEIAEFSYSSGTDNVRVQTKVPGTAMLELRDEATAEVVDRVAFRVEPVASIRLTSVESPERLSVMEGGRLDLGVDPIGADDCRMFGVGGLDYTLTGGLDTTRITLVDWLTDVIVGTLVGNSDGVSIRATSAGAGELLISAPSGAALTIPIAVVTETAAATVELSGEPISKVTESSRIEATVHDANGALIYDPRCVWTLSPASGPVELESSSRDAAMLSASAPGSASITCTVGAAVGNLQVSFE